MGDGSGSRVFFRFFGDFVVGRERRRFRGRCSGMCDRGSRGRVG